jgi:hypothetical protein
MSKYSVLADYLRAQNRDEVPMTFKQIERLIGQKLPASHRFRSWWSNNSFNSVMTRAWLDAGFASANVNMKDRKLTFRRVKRTSADVGDVSSKPDKRPAISKRHPMFGALKGVTRIAAGVDLTEPADPEWGERAWGDLK